MTAAELISDLQALGPQDLGVLLHYLADHLEEARMANGGRLIDQIDFKQWLQELAEAARQ